MIWCLTYYARQKVNETKMFPFGRIYIIHLFVTFHIHYILHIYKTYPFATTLLTSKAR